jgi:hypothetical protein
MISSYSNLAYIACEEGFFVWFRRFLATGARFDTVDWARKVRSIAMR